MGRLRARRGEDEEATPIEARHRGGYSGMEAEEGRAWKGNVSTSHQFIRSRTTSAHHTVTAQARPPPRACSYRSIAVCLSGSLRDHREVGSVLKPDSPVAPPSEAQT